MPDNMEEDFSSIITPFEMLTAVIANLLDHFFHDAVLIFPVVMLPVKAPYVGGVGVEQFPDEMVHRFAFNEKKKTEDRVERKAEALIPRLQFAGEIFKLLLISYTFKVG